MEEQLSHIQSLIEERWKWAHTKKNENDKLLKRKICLEDELKRLVKRRVEKEFEEANIRKEIVTQEQTLDEIQQKIYEERKETMKIERKLFHMDALAQRYEKIITEEKAKSELFWNKLMKEQDAMKEQDCNKEKRQEEELLAKQEKLHALKQRLAEVEVQNQIEEKAHTDFKLLYQDLEKKRTILVREIEEARKENETLKQRAQTQRQHISLAKSHALEKRVDKLLHELEEDMVSVTH